MSSLSNTKLDVPSVIKRFFSNGSLITVVTLLTIELLSRRECKIPHPAPIFLTAVVYAACNGGLYSGFYSAGITLLYAFYFFSSPGWLFHYSDDHLQCLIGLAVITPAIAIIAGVYKHRTELVARAELGKCQQVESALKKSEQQFRLLIESVQDYAIFTMDTNGYINSWNPGLERILGYSEAEIIGKPCACIFTPEDLSNGDDKQELQTAAAEGKAVDERWHVKANGTRFWGSGIVTPLRDEVGNLLGFSKIMRDVTERKQAEIERDSLIEQLAAERSYLEAVVQQMPVGVAIADAPTGKLRLHNEEAVRILRHPMISSNTVKDYAQYGAFHPNRQPYKSEEYPIARSITSGEVVKAEEMHYRRGDGTETFFLVNSAPVIDSSGRIVAAVSTFYDIDQRKQAELALQQSEARLRLALEAAHMSIWDWNIQTNQIDWSSNYEQLFGFAPGTFGGTYEDILSRIYPEDSELAAAAVACSLEQREGYNSEFRIVCPDGNIRWLAGKGRFFYDETGTKPVRMMGIIMDITERKRTAEQIKASLQETAELKKLNQLKDDFLSTVSHELRTPMSNMKMAIQMLKVSLTHTNERTQRYLDILQAECTREIELINDLLDLQRLETSPHPRLLIEAINLQDCLPPLIEPFQVRTQQQQQTLRLSLPDHIPALFSDRANLERILTELLNNACKYTPTGGEIILDVSYQSVKAATIFTISNSREIPPAQLPYIFDKFYRLPNNDPWKQGGTGLGLALVRKLVEQLQGAIAVESSNGWTTFTVQLSN